MKKRIAPFIIIILVSFFPFTVLSEDLEQMMARFKPGQRNQVTETESAYYIQSVSNFHDAQARRSLVLLSKAILLKHIQKIDNKVTGLEINGYYVQNYYKKEGLLYALSCVDKTQIKKIYTKQSKKIKPNKPINDEIAHLESVEPKTKTIHEQLKELYFILGDIDNYNKQSDILMEIMFNGD